MAFKKKSSHKIAYLAIILLIVLVASAVAVIFAMQPSTKVVVGVHVGDTFTYELHGYSYLQGLGAVDTEGFSRYNDTDYYSVTITDVTGTTVSLDTVWALKNGTQYTDRQTIDLANGNKTNTTTGFWAIYASNLNIGQLTRPKGFDTVTVNATNVMDYANSSRPLNYMYTGGESKLMTDPSGSTLRYDSVNVYFDKKSGMLESMTWITDYNNPEMREIISWTLVNTSVWTVQ